MDWYMEKFIITQDGDVIKDSTQMSLSSNKFLPKLFIIDSIIIYHSISLQQ